MSISLSTTACRDWIAGTGYSFGVFNVSLCPFGAQLGWWLKNVTLPTGGSNWLFTMWIMICILVQGRSHMKINSILFYSNWPFRCFDIKETSIHNSETVRNMQHDKVIILLTKYFSMFLSSGGFQIFSWLKRPHPPWEPWETWRTWGEDQKWKHSTSTRVEDFEKWW